MELFLFDAVMEPVELPVDDFELILSIVELTMPLVVLLSVRIGVGGSG